MPSERQTHDTVKCLLLRLGIITDSRQPREGSHTTDKPGCSVDLWSVKHTEIKPSKLPALLSEAALLMSAVLS